MKSQLCLSCMYYTDSCENKDELRERRLMGNIQYIHPIGNCKNYEPDSIYYPLKKK